MGFSSWNVQRVFDFALRHVVPAVEPGPIRRSPSRGHGVWVPAFAGTTAWSGLRAPTKKCVHAGAFAGTSGLLICPSESNNKITFSDRPHVELRRRRGDADRE